MCDATREGAAVQNRDKTANKCVDKSTAQNGESAQQRHDRGDDPGNVAWRRLIVYLLNYEKMAVNGEKRREGTDTKRHTHTHRYMTVNTHTRTLQSTKKCKKERMTSSETRAIGGIGSMGNCTADSKKRQKYLISLFVR